MKFIVTPGHSVFGDITVPGDKSISHRAVLLSALSNSTTDIFNLSFGTDVLHSVEAMRALGVTISLNETKKSARIRGVGLSGLQSAKTPIDCGNSGTLMRLLAGILAAQKFNSVLIGDASLSKRPMLRIAEPLRLMGADIQLSSENTAPIEITGNQILHGIDYEPSIPSAQVKSAILLAGLYADGKTIVHEKIKTRDHTERMITFFGLFEKERQCATLRKFDVPGDISSAAFFIVLATITKNAEINIRDVGVNPCRTGVISILKLMGADIEIVNQRFFGNEPVADLIVKYAPLQGIVIPESLITSAIDEFPVIFIAAACANGKTILRHASELRVKESDRIAAMAENLKKLGVSIVEYEDGLEIQGSFFWERGAGWDFQSLDAKGDHRIAMALAIAGQVAKKSISIDNCDFVKTSFPNFVEIALSVGMKIEDES